MVPAKQNETNALLPIFSRTIITRSKASATNQNHDGDDQQPLQPPRGVKRSVLGNLTNAAVLHTEPANNKKTAASKTVTKVFKPDPDGPRTRAATKILTRAASRQQLIENNANNDQAPIGQPLQTQISTLTNTIVKTKDATFDGAKPQMTAAITVAQRRVSAKNEKTEDSLYMSTSEDIPSNGSLRLSENFGSASSSKRKHAKVMNTYSPRKRTPIGIMDYDFMNWNDPYQVSNYAQDIFSYQQERESQFVIPDYMAGQPYISDWMRALLVDWMVETQESFELNHETLYLAVKIVDIYLSRVKIRKELLQLIGVAALFLASKYDERGAPFLDDFHYICDGAYERRDIVIMEIQLFKTVGFDLGIPLSYTFLRRYARVNHVEWPVLTLARYILEFSLMDYATVKLRDSKLACAALFIAMRMNDMPGWSRTLEFYTRYRIEDFAEIAILLNNIMTRKPKESLKTVRQKYSHEVFFKSAKKPFITDLDKLFDTTGYDLSSIRTPTTAASSRSHAASSATMAV